MAIAVNVATFGNGRMEDMDKSPVIASCPCLLGLREVFEVGRLSTPQNASEMRGRNSGR